MVYVPIPCSTNILGCFFPISSVSLDIETKGKVVLEITKMYKIIEQEMNKMAIHTHVIFRPRNAMLYFEYKNSTFLLFPKHFSFYFYVQANQ